MMHFLDISKTVIRKFLVLFITALVAAPLATAYAQGFGPEWKKMDSEQLRGALENFYNNISSNDDEIVGKWFSPNYVQIADGKTLSFSDFTRHLKILKRDTQSLRFKVLDVAYTGNTLADRHIVYVTKKNGQKSEFEFLAFLRIENGKLVRINETSRLLSGQESDKDLGSRTK